ncbi:MAG: hypothetical protein KAS99_00115 [Candidatus Omnitrophica bacterium]|nr:hypothetical protein [Candidatus Omnitrophota bacterium]
MSKYSEVKKYLDSFIDYERKCFFPYKKSLNLKRTEKLLSTLNLSYRDLKVIHIAGTKGKGSCATFCAYILAYSGYKVGLYTSPHFFDFRERIRIVTKHKLRDTGVQRAEEIPRKTRVKDQPAIYSYMIAKKDVVKIVEEFKLSLERLRFTKRYGKLTFFEIYTAIAFKYFREKNLDFVVLETGLGGRLDATNVVIPLVSIITHIGYDHTQTLGKGLKDIAYEKAGVIKNNISVVSSSQRPSVLEQIKKRAKELNAPLYILGKDFYFCKVKLNGQSTVFDFYPPSRSKRPAFSGKTTAMVVDSARGGSAFGGECGKNAAAADVTKAACFKADNLPKAVISEYRGHAPEMFHPLAINLFRNRGNSAGTLRTKVKLRPSLECRDQSEFCPKPVRISNLKLKLKGHHQIENASLVLAGLSILKKEGIINKNLEFKKGIKNSFIEGRFEIVKREPLIILDIAHNPSSFSALGKTINIYFPGREIILIFAASNDKDIKNMLNKVNFKNIIVTAFNNPRSLSCYDLQRRIGLKKTFAAKNVKEALNLGLEIYKKDSLILAAGSFFLIAEIKKLIKR